MAQATVWAKIYQGVVVNIQMCENGDHFDPADTWVDLGMNPNAVDIGWTYDGTSFFPPVVQ